MAKIMNTREGNLTMIFDVETTGLLKKKQPVSEIPYITQLCYLVYDEERKEVIKTFNKYIVIPEDIEISMLITELTGITKDICNSGHPIENVLAEFYSDYAKCVKFVAHNIEFDHQMIKIEMARNDSKLKSPEINIQDSYIVFNSDFIPKSALCCTMKRTTILCGIWVERWGKLHLKWPTLEELHMKLFGEMFV
jgi:DNA polymerase III epsilon subunit-like protein